MKICLINPPITGKRFEGYEWSNNSYTIQHLGLGYIAGMLESNGYQTDIIECPGNDIDVFELCKIIKSNNYNIIGISTYFFNFYNVMRIASNLKSENSDLFIFLGGYLPTLCCDMVLEKAKGVDCCVLGEGEYACLELVKAISNQEDWKSLKSIAYLKDGKPYINPRIEPMKNLDSLPLPKRVILSNMFVPISTSRGCYGRCNYCGVREFYELCEIKAMRFRSPENVIYEIEQIQKENKIDVFLISDETFFSPALKRRQWLEQFYFMLKEKKLNIKFQALARANDVISNEDIIVRMKEVGLINVFIGVESFVQRQLDFYQKLTTVEQNVKAIEILKKNNFKVSLGLMLIDPYVTIDELIQNIDYLKKSECYKIVDEKQELFSIDGPVIAIPGTKLYNDLEKEGLLKANDIKYDVQDQKAAFCYKILNEWRKYVKPVSSLFYLVRMAQKYEWNEEYDYLLKLKSEVMLFDLNFFELLCYEIKNEKLHIDNYHSFMDEWIKKAKKYEEKWNSMKKQMKEKYREETRDKKS